MADHHGSEDCDVCIVGAGVAGLSAALLLARCVRRVIVFDSGKPRNFASRGLHGYLTRDGVHPVELRDLGRAEIARYPTVSLRDVEVVGAHRGETHFEIRPREGATVTARALLLATGRCDVLPDKPGMRELYGRGVYHCPICDGWEHRGEPLVLYGRGNASAQRALALLAWSPRVTFCSDGAADLKAEEHAQLKRNGIKVVEDEVAAAVPGPDGHLAGVRFADGSALECRALFFDAECPQKSALAENLGCRIDHTGAVVCRGPNAADVPGLFVAGNVRRGIHLAITAAAEGAEAALAIHDLLLEQDLG